MLLPFNSSPQMSLGLEVELQILDQQTGDLVPAAPAILDRSRAPQGRIKPEIFQSMIEINTAVCGGAREAGSDLARSLAHLETICGSLGVALASAGSHPFARYDEIEAYPSERFSRVLDRNQWIAQRLMIFGMHVHVGVRDGEHAMGLINSLLPYLPHILALSASSPFWQGVDTRLASSRITLFESLPTAGPPCIFRSWSDFAHFHDAAITSGAITSVKDLWWDVRPQPEFGTVEIRICDSLPTLSETVYVATFVHLLCRWLDGHGEARRQAAALPAWVLRENKWRASRWGLDAEIVVDAEGRTSSLRTELRGLIDAVAPMADDASCRADLDGARRMLERPPSPDRQRAVFDREGSLQAVVRALVQELRTDSPILEGL